jgi:hypothetical protein
VGLDDLLHERQAEAGAPPRCASPCWRRGRTVVNRSGSRGGVECDCPGRCHRDHPPTRPSAARSVEQRSRCRAGEELLRVGRTRFVSTWRRRSASAGALGGRSAATSPGANVWRPGARRARAWPRATARARAGGNSKVWRPDSSRGMSRKSVDQAGSGGSISAVDDAQETRAASRAGTRGSASGGGASRRSREGWRAARAQLVAGRWRTEMSSLRRSNCSLRRRHVADRAHDPGSDAPEGSTQRRGV